MILLCGIPSESPIRLVNERLNTLGIETVIFSQRQINDAEIEWKWIKNKPQGNLHLFNCSYELNKFSGIYLRMMDDSYLPEIKNNAEEEKERSKIFHQKLTQWMEVNNNIVVNKYSSMFSNSSKPYQAQIIRKFGLETPPTLITNNINSLREFQKKYPHIIYKSISGIRSIVKEFLPEDEDRLAMIQYCPVQFQAKLDGYDVRVHVIGNKTFATKIKTTGVDYRYAHKEKGGSTELKETKIPKYVQEACINVSAHLGLHFSGIDLRFTTDGKVYCFEVNPMPGYSYYESNTGQPISLELANYLCGKSEILVK